MKYTITKKQLDYLIESKQKKKNISDFLQKMTEIGTNVKNSHLSDSLKQELVEEFKCKKLLNEKEIKSIIG